LRPFAHLVRHFNVKVIELADSVCHGSSLRSGHLHSYESAMTAGSSIRCVTVIRMNLTRAAWIAVQFVFSCNHQRDVHARPGALVFCDTQPLPVSELCAASLASRASVFPRV